MTRTLLSTAAMLGLLIAPAVAQTSTEQTPSATDDSAAAASTDNSTVAASDQQVRDRAVKNAEGLGMQNVTVMDRVFVVQGNTPEGETVFMIVNPPGALIGLGGPVASGAASAANNAEVPATTPYMAAQRQPASPEMWDPEGLETRLTELGFSDFADMKQDGDQVSLKARKDDKDIVLIIDLKGGEIWDDAQQRLGSLNEPATSTAN